MMSHGGHVGGVFGGGFGGFVSLTAMQAHQESEFLALLRLYDTATKTFT